jgi:hypothetical protein
MEAMEAHAAAPGLDELRTLLILLGQLEQAVDDTPDILPCPELHAITDLVAAAFVAVLQGRVPDIAFTARLLAAFDQLKLDPTAQLCIKIPESFAFYTLYPEQYYATALRWATGREPDAPVVVAGIRSIGTSLSAVVAQTLAARGWTVRRLSVRPDGHPFAREARVDPLAVREAGWGLVVDEGPGISGSSMAAVGAALAQAGVEPSRIAFLPSHGGEPGSAASEEVRGWWQRAPRLYTLLSDLRLGGHDLPGALAAATETLCGERVVATDDCGGGLWRRLLIPDYTNWPASYQPFERTKYRCTTSSGVQMLWKFGGLAGGPPGLAGPWQSSAEAEAASLTKRAERSLAPCPLAVRHGFIALPWLDGMPLQAADATPVLLDRIGRYIVLVAGPPLAAGEQMAGHARLAEMLYWNTWELLGEGTATRTQAWSEAAASAIVGPFPCYGDGRLAPHEWLRVPRGTIHKTDAGGHALDHTMVGRQPVVWDLAGAMVEWNLDDATAAPLLAGYDAAGGPPYGSDLLTFYRLAYLAFRAGQAALCAGMVGHDPDEQARLWTAQSRYAVMLERLLALELPRRP